MLVVAAEVLVILLVASTVLPAPGSDAAFQASTYLTHVAWFAAVGWFLLQLAWTSELPLRTLLGVLGCLFVLVMVGNVLELRYVTDILKLAFAGLAGHAFLRAIERPWWLVPIAVCVPLADAWSVFSDRGVTNAVVERAEEDPTWIEWPTIAAPIGGAPYELFGRLGIVDILFMALFIGAAVRWRLGVARVLVACVAGFLATDVLVLRTDLAVPALPTLCIAFLVACGPALWRDARDEWSARSAA